MVDKNEDSFNLEQEFSITKRKIESELAAFYSKVDCTQLQQKEHDKVAKVQREGFGRKVFSPQESLLRFILPSPFSFIAVVRQKLYWGRKTK